jgi:cysteinyl-tRNA synthetase
MKLKLFDTYTRRREFKLLDPAQACIPVDLLCMIMLISVIRHYIFEDILRRTLELDGFTVRHVMNITDVGHLTSDADTGEDKMEKGSERRKTPGNCREYAQALSRINASTC